MKRLSIAFRCFFSLLFKGTISETLLVELQARLARPTTDEESVIGAAPATGSVLSQTVPLPAERAPAEPVPRMAAGAERAVQILALLQRDARLIDFFAEDIGGYEDAQVGAAVRDLHASGKTTIERYLTLEPVVAREEGSEITVEAGFDPGAIKLLGNVTGKLPARGVLRHHGWRAGEVRLPDVPSGANRAIIAPAEVELA